MKPVFKLDGKNWMAKSLKQKFSKIKEKIFSYTVALIVSIVILVCVTIDFIRFEFIDSKFG